MGGIESLLTVAERRIPGIVAWIGIVPTENLAGCYANPLFSAIIRDANGIAVDGSDYAAKMVGHDPVLKSGPGFRGIAMWALVANGRPVCNPGS